MTNPTAPRTAAELPSIERLHELLDYCPDTGTFRWRLDRGPVRAGAIAGALKSSGHRLLSIDYQRILASRAAWALHYGTWPRYEIGHLDGDVANDAIANLIDAPRGIHHCNSTRARSNNASGVHGVHHRAGNRYIARFMSKSIGAFDTPEAAHLHYVRAKIEAGKVYRPAILEANRDAPVG